MDRGSWRDIVNGVLNSRTQLKWLSMRDLGESVLFSLVWKLAWKMFLEGKLSLSASLCPFIRLSSSQYPKSNAQRSQTDKKSFGMHFHAKSDVLSLPLREIPNYLEWMRIGGSWCFLAVHFTKSEKSWGKVGEVLTLVRPLSCEFWFCF